MTTREIYESANTNIPEGATGMRFWDGFTEFFSGSTKDGWRLICSNAPDVDSIPASKPVIEIAKQEKPKRVNVEWERINPDVAYWALVKEWSDIYDSNIYYSDDGSFIAVSSNQVLLDEYFGGNLFRRVEVEVEPDWRDELENHRYVLNSPYYSMRNHPDKFIAMCHAIADMTDKPTN